MTPNTLAQHYSRWSIALHWLMAVLLVATAATMELKGIYPKGSTGRSLLMSVHYALGLSVFSLVWLRLLARALGPTPAISRRHRPPGRPCWGTPCTWRCTH